MNAYTVVIPAFNADRFLAETIDSVLAQTVPPGRIIIADDGSTDGTRRVAEGFGDRVVYLHQPNTGPGAATTLGLRAVTTPFAATVDSDDLWQPQKAERQLALLDADPSLAAVFCPLLQFTEDPGDPRNGVIGDGWSRTSIMMRTSLFHATGPLVDQPGRLGEFIDWVARAREAGARFFMMEEPLARRRIRPDSLSAGRNPERDRGYVHAARLAILRRRAAAKG